MLPSPFAVRTPTGQENLRISGGGVMSTGRRGKRCPSRRRRERMSAATHPTARTPRVNYSLYNRRAPLSASPSLVRDTGAFLSDPSSASLTTEAGEQEVLSLPTHTRATCAAAAAPPPPHPPPLSPASPPPLLPPPPSPPPFANLESAAMSTSFGFSKKSAKKSAVGANVNGAAEAGEQREYLTGVSGAGLELKDKAGGLLRTSTLHRR